MKTFLKFSGIFALIVAVVAFILVMATPAISIHVIGNTYTNIAGTSVIFGESALGIQVWNPSPLSLIAWILLIVALLLLVFGALLPFLKVKSLNKFAGLLNIIAVVSLVVAGIFIFITVPAFYGAQGSDVNANAALSAGWVIEGILSIAAGVLAVAPAFADFISKK